MLSSANNSTNASVNYTSLNSTNPLSAEEMFKKLSNSGSVIDANFPKNKEEDNNPNGLRLASNEDNSDIITKDADTDNKISYIFPKSKNKDNSNNLISNYGNNGDDEDEFYYDGKASSVTTSFEALAAAVGSSGSKITKEQLMTYLQSLMTDPSSSSENVAEITFLKNLIAKFDALSDGSDFITSLQGAKEPQDYTTITTEQVTSPVDIRV